MSLFCDENDHRCANPILFGKIVRQDIAFPFFGVIKCAPNKSLQTPHLRKGALITVGTPKLLSQLKSFVF